MAGARVCGAIAGGGESIDAKTVAAQQIARMGIPDRKAFALRITCKYLLAGRMFDLIADRRRGAAAAKRWG